MSTGLSLYCDGYGSYDRPKIFLRIKPLKEIEKNIKKKYSSREFDNKENEHRINCILWRVRKLWLFKNFLLIQPRKEVKKNSHRENLTMKKMSTGLSVYYDRYGSYDCSKNFLLIKPLKGVKQTKLEKFSSREFDNEENEHWTKFVLRRVR